MLGNYARVYFQYYPHRRTSQYRQILRMWPGYVISIFPIVKNGQAYLVAYIRKP